MKHIDEINGRGLANGWHAQELAKKAAAAGKSMAECFRESIANSSAFNVPATCIKVTAGWITYRFSDSSTARFQNQR